MAIFDLKANIDLKQNLNLYTTCKQLDSLNLILSVFDNSVQTNLTNYNVRLKAMKADKVPLVQEHTGISISSNVITIETDEQLTTTSGKTLIELQFIDEVTGKKKATFNLVLIVVSTTLEVDRGISKATYTLLEELENKLDQASDFFENIEDAIVANNNLKKTISNSETAESNLETAITNANNKKNEVYEAITNATNKIEEVEQSIINANNSKTELDASKTIADTTKIDLDNANVQAEKNIEELNKLGDATDLAAKVQTNTENISKNTKSIESLDAQMNEIANKNLIINGEPLIWQRGTSLVNIQDFCADRWLYVCWASSSASGKIEKDFDGSMKMTDFNTTGNYIQQIIETSTSEKLANKKITLSADIKANNINIGNIYIQLVFSNGVDKIDYSGIVTHQELVIAPSDITSDYKRFKLTVDVPDTTKTISVQIGSHSTLGEVVNNDCILNIRNIKLELGEKATPFQPELYSDVLNQCMRYFQPIRFQWIAHDPTTLFCMNPNYYIPMRAIPTVGLNLANADHFGGGHVEITGSLSFQGTINSSIFYIVSSKSEFLTGEKYSIFANLDSEIR